MKYIYQGIEGLEGSRNTFGTVLTIGEKGAKGNPTNTHQFFVKKPQAVTKQLGSRKGLVRENDPEFVQFNKSDRPELRSVMRFTIVHAVHMREGWHSMVDAFQFQLFAQQLPEKNTKTSPAQTDYANSREADHHPASQKHNSHSNSDGQNTKPGRYCQHHPACLGHTPGTT